MKYLKRIVLWDHTCQVIWVLIAAIDGFLWFKGKARHLDTFLIGFAIAAAWFWQFMLIERNRKRRWMELALNPRNIDFEVKMVEAAKNLVDARQMAQHIDPNKN